MRSFRKNLHIKCYDVKTKCPLVRHHSDPFTKIIELWEAQDVALSHGDVITRVICKSPCTTFFTCIFINFMRTSLMSTLRKEPFSCPFLWPKSCSLDFELSKRITSDFHSSLLGIHHTDYNNWMWRFNPMHWWKIFMWKTFLLHHVL